MDLVQLIKGRRTIQSFNSEKVPDEWVEEALRLSLWAPNHRLTFPWFYALVGAAARAQLAELVIEMKNKKFTMTDIAKEAAKAAVLNPSHLLCIGVKREENPVVDKENYASLACSMQIFAMYLWERGVGTKWSSGGYTTNSKTYEILGISSEKVRLEGWLTIGKPKAVPPVHERPKLEDVLIRVP